MEAVATPPAKPTFSIPTSSNDSVVEIHRIFELQKKNNLKLKTSSVDDRIARLKKMKEV
jgi:hypothetical protein